MATATQSTDKFLTFKLNKEGFAVDVMQVVEIIRLQKITPVPHMPSYFKGVINLRGRVIPILDLRERFALSNLETSEHTCIIVVQVTTTDKATLAAGLIVDEVEEVLTIAEESIQPTPEVGNRSAADYLRGITTLRDQVRTILDLPKLLGEELTLRKA
jgi:purine-binding chemotaxis protein CheW